VITFAAIYWKVDKLIGLNENVIIGKMIPARYPAYEEVPEEEVPELIAGEEDKEELAI